MLGTWPPHCPLVPGIALCLPAAPLPPSLRMEGLRGGREQQAVGHRCDCPAPGPYAQRHRPANPPGWPCCDTEPGPVGRGQSSGKVTVCRGPRMLGMFQLDLWASAFCRLSPGPLPGLQRGGRWGARALLPQPPPTRLPPGLSSPPHS